MTSDLNTGPQSTNKIGTLHSVRNIGRFICCEFLPDRPLDCNNTDKNDQRHKEPTSVWFNNFHSSDATDTVIGQQDSHQFASLTSWIMT
ncbi:hypothetical protein PROFUN_09709 [Planoprotostelium fungivorum]|uniref:Uncharacterized protein n=1 Tax=Planoprotostelium fungivorum TaxID=1890364 RepID=A0A2P6NEV5_9EUKA|nr:hypothetical protein PROFUN_09709 [Planoprotostelium fungivorum]